MSNGETVTPVAPYPIDREADVALRDGSTIRVRPVRSEDEERLLAFLLSLSEASRALRFLAAVSEPFLAAVAREEARVDYKDTFGLVALAGPNERIVGHAMYAALGPERAEAAYAVADDYQGRGLGTILLGHLCEAAADRGVRILENEVLAENYRMVQVFRESGFPIEVRAEANALHITFPTKLTEEALRRFENRERSASINALKAFLQPRSVAVIGASRERGTIGGEILHNLLTLGFTGPVYAVNSRAPVVEGVPAYESVAAIPGDITLAVIAVPAPQVLSVAQECAHKGVRALVTISAGFVESGPEGAERQANLLRICRAAGMRLIGPNSVGIINTDPTVRLDVTFAPSAPPPGRVAFSSQSGALGLAVIEHANNLGLGISSFVSVGNKADISGNDLLSYWESDPNTDVILLYLESFGNPRKFARIARRVGKTKPIIAVKSGRSKAAGRAASSHTGALLASADITVDALFRQTGVIRTDTLEELFDVASLLAHQPAPMGRRVAIITNAGGPGIMCADMCEAEGLEVPVMSAETQAQLRAFLVAEASVGNPVDMNASASAESYRRAIRTVGADPTVDALIVIYSPPFATGSEEVAGAIEDGARELVGNKTILKVFMSTRGGAMGRTGARVPSYVFPEAAGRALARAARYGEWRAKAVPTLPQIPDVRQDDAAAMVSVALGRGAGWMRRDEVAGLLACYGLPLADGRLTMGVDEAATAAEEIGGCVALKAIVPGLLHKNEAGAVHLGLHRGEEVRAAALDMQERLGTKGREQLAFLVQRMPPEGVEMIVGVVHDHHFGPVVACAAGGVQVELLGDVAVRLTPLTAADASEMIQSLRIYPLLNGFQGRAPCDVKALEDALLRVGALVEDLPEIAELNCNPIVVHEGGACLVDARVRIEAAVPPPPLSARR